MVATLRVKMPLEIPQRGENYQGRKKGDGLSRQQEPENAVEIIFRLKDFQKIE
jgi:hypothetical protein